MRQGLTFWLLLRRAPGFRWLVLGAAIATVLVMLFPPRLGPRPPALGPGSYAAPATGPQATIPPPPPIPTGLGSAGFGSRVRPAAVAPPSAPLPPQPPVPPVARLPGSAVTAPAPSLVPANRIGVLPSGETAAVPATPTGGNDRLTTRDGRPLAPATRPVLVPAPTPSP